MPADVRVINESFMTVGTIDWRKAICMWARGRVEIVEDIPTELIYQNPKFFGDSLFLYRPKTVRMLDYKPPKKMRRYKRLTKKTLFERDKGKCGYCGKKLTLSSMTVDHVMPRSKNGEHKWQNVVSSCSACNSKKGDRTPQEAGMQLKTRVYLPSFNEWAPGVYRNEFFKPGEDLSVASSHPLLS